MILQDVQQNWGYMSINSTQCGEQITGDLPMDFFTSAWETYDRCCFVAKVACCAHLG